MNVNKRKLALGLVYLAISLIIVNFIFQFIPWLEYRMPSYSKTTVLGKEYLGWYTKGISPFKIIIPDIFFGLPLLCIMISFFGKKKSKLNQIANDAVIAPARFGFLKFGIIVNFATIFIAHAFVSDEISYYVKHGSYCKVTAFGIIGAVFSIALFITLTALTILSKTMIRPVEETTSVLENDAQAETSSDVACDETEETIDA